MRQEVILKLGYIPDSKIILSYLFIFSGASAFNILQLLSSDINTAVPRSHPKSLYISKRRLANYSTFFKTLTPVA
jgi:hypothetical protein